MPLKKELIGERLRLWPTVISPSFLSTSSSSFVVAANTEMAASGLETTFSEHRCEWKTAKRPNS